MSQKPCSKTVKRALREQVQERGVIAILEEYQGIFKEMMEQGTLHENVAQAIEALNRRKVANRFCICYDDGIVYSS